MADKRFVIGAPQLADTPAGKQLQSTIKFGSAEYPMFFKTGDAELTPRIEPFLALTLMPAMAQAAPIVAEAPVTADFLARANRVQHTWQRSYPQTKPIAIEAETEPVAPLPTGTGVGAFFSLGVDSFHTYFKHAHELTSLIFVHGFDIPLRNEWLRSRVSYVLRDVAAELGIAAVEVATSARWLLDEFTPWIDSHGIATTAVALALQPGFRKFHLPGENRATPEMEQDLGFRRDVDPLWGTDGLELAHDGDDLLRSQKLRALIEHPIVRRSLRVCWINPDNAYNCCLCKKCLINMALIDAFGFLPETPAFHRPLDPSLIRRIPIENRNTWHLLEELRRTVVDEDGDPALVAAFDDCLAERYWHSPRGRARQGAQWAATTSRRVVRRARHALRV